MSIDGRSADTREKIKLGGLIVKAGLREADSAFLLGGLMHLARLREQGGQSEEVERLRAAGAAVFDQDQAKARAVFEAGERARVEKAKRDN